MSGNPTTKIQLAVFRIGETSYALDIMRIKEVINPLPITPVPRAPASLEGVERLKLVARSS